MTRQWIALVVVSMGVVAGSTTIAAQDLLPCKPLAPGARCGVPSGHVWQLDFGAPKLAPAPQLEAQHWQWLGVTHRDASGRIMPAPVLEVPGLLDHPVDCKMAKPVHSSIDTKIIAPHPGHTVLSGRVITVAPCKSK
jgi:hypothetical protein